jgi:hypothetical protein
LFNQINETNQTNQMNQPVALVVDFNAGWWIATMGASVSSGQDPILPGNLGHYTMSMMAQTLRFTWGKIR